MLLIVVSPHHQSPTPLRVDLGTHTLLITSESTRSPSVKTTRASARFDHEGAYRLYLCLHVLFQPHTQQGEQ